MEKQTPKNNLKKLRIEKGFSQKEFYEDIIKKELGLDITLRTYQNWENPNNEIKSKPALLLAEYFGVNVGYLLGEDERRTTYLMDIEDLLKKNLKIGIKKKKILC